MFDFKKLIKSFYYAGRGLFYIFKKEQNFRLEIFGSIAILVSMFYYEASWIKIILAGFLFLLILVLEIINTVFEEITDFLAQNHRLGDCSDITMTGAVRDIKIRNAKDLAAGGVLLVGTVSLLLLLAILFKI